MTTTHGRGALSPAIIVLAMLQGCTTSHLDDSGNRGEPLRLNPTKLVASALQPPADAAVEKDLKELPALCQKVCAASTSLRCKRADGCAPNCRYMASIGNCKKEVLAFYKCLVPHPVEHWECLEDGSGAIREGFCDKEQAAITACLQGSTSH